MFKTTLIISDAAYCRMVADLIISRAGDKRQPLHIVIDSLISAFRNNSDSVVFKLPDDYEAEDIQKLLDRRPDGSKLARLVKELAYIRKHPRLPEIREARQKAEGGTERALWDEIDVLLLNMEGIE